MVRTRSAAEPGKQTGKHGGNRSGHHAAKNAKKEARGSRQAAGKDPHRLRKGRR